MLYLILILFSTATYAQEDLFKDYYKLVTTQNLTSAEALNYLTNSEKQFFKEIVTIANDIKFDDSQLSYLSTEDNFKESQRAWKHHSKKFKIEKQLNKIIKNPNSAIKDPALARALKDNRKFAHIMRESFYLFDVEHTVPEILDNFVKPFGKLNDAIVLGQKKLIKKYAKQVLKNYKTVDLKVLGRKFTPIKTEEFFKYMQSIRSEANGIFQKTVTTTHDFHTIRKFYKRFLYIYYTLDDYIALDKFAKLDVYITKFGELNDIYTDMKFRYGIDIKKYEVNFPKNFKHEVLDTLHYLEEDMATVELVKGCGSFFLQRR